ncbi:Bug family tripartite tricarboxylate transporter substrate binding protein [Neotabrizicola sp. sgz301269]|uniref:Bug family tripartite tricarboxylate transporter substrate binding protein n=1 Tax=Neotabrizicola sp. sgz301269 TaxID=3276282 RepID=UPI00377045E5
MKPKFRLLLGAALSLPLFMTAAFAQDFPNQPIKFIVPFNSGGGTDIVARIVADEMSKNIGQPVLVENQPGAQGISGTRAGADAPADGYTMTFVLQATMALNRSLYTATNYDALNDFAFVSQLSEAPYVVAVNANLGATTLDELVAKAKAEPGKINFASGAAASYLASLLFQKEVGVEMVHIPYSGSGAALTDLLSGRVSLMLSSPSSVLPHFQSGALVPLAVTGAERLPSLPDVPTLDELGYKGFNVTGWYGVAVPDGTPDAVVEKLNTSINEALANPDVQASLESAGAAAKGGSAADFSAFVAAEIDRWTAVIAEAGIQPQ